MFAYGGWGQGGAGTTLPEQLWVGGPGTSPRQVPNEEHSYVFDVQDMPYRIVDADGSHALYMYQDSGETEQIYSLDLATGAKTLIAEGGFSPTSISPDGDYALIHGGGHNMTVVNRSTGERRDTYLDGVTDLPWWFGNVSDLTTGGRRYFTAGRKTSGSQAKYAEVQRVDLVAPGA